MSKLTFVGGEPFLHPHLEALAAEAKAAGLVTAAVTNGSLLTEERLRRMAGAGEVDGQAGRGVYTV